ncbi:hypothetical protein ACJRO7_017529 [Eucalyptus globulus]|uniref:Uncharacterized protein n=1 Tax=Eucalyptus globulus TaxID=34317 RepID=A0ABD3KRC0_EUCGL
MKNRRLSSQFLFSAIFFFFFTILSLPHAKGREPISSIAKIHDLSDLTHQWRHAQMMKSQETNVKFKLFSPPMVQAGVLCFVEAVVSSAGAMGGGGLFVPILAIFAGLQLKTASSFSAFMVTGVSIANIIYYLIIKSPQFGGKCLIDYDISLLSEPCLPLGVSLQLKTASSFLAFMVTGVSIANFIYYLIIKSPQFGGKCLIDYDIALLSEPCLLLGVSIGVICNVVFPEWLITMLFAVFLARSTFKSCKKGFSYWKMESEGGREIVHLEKGSVREEAFGGSEEAKVAIEPVLHDEPKCQDQFPWMKLGVLVLVWFSFFSVHIFHGNQHVQDVDDPNREGPANILIFPVMALHNLQLVLQVTVATCSFMVFFSSTMSALQYLVLGMEHPEIALILSFTCFVTSLLGIIVVQRAVRLYGRASLIMFSMTIVMASSTVFIAGFGAIEIWKDYISGKFMGFKPPC